MAGNAAAQGQLPEVLTVQGSRATAPVIRKIQETLRAEHYPDCHDINPVRVAETSPAHMARAPELAAGSVWGETWLLEICGKKRIHHIDFAMVPASGELRMEASVQPAQATAMDASRPQAPVDRSKLPMVLAVPGSPATPPVIIAVQEVLQGSSYPDCPQIRPARSLSIFPANALRKTVFSAGDTWAETWLVETCDGPKKHHIDFYIAPAEKELRLLIRTQPALEN